ncbi:MAG: DNA polymerase III subunit gamma/tau [Firmicutes bacterium]|nr:DNA polymerase III subunit gamma/tau [Bacillota bacterium]
MYQALYRKYRPNNFSEVIGQDVIKKTIVNEINNNKVSHAYLFCGPRGTGKTSIAKLIAKLINCENQNNGIPCEACKSCLSYKNNVDIIEIDAASNNGVDEIRELRNKVNLLPANSKYKIYIIDEVHMLSIGAFNALLKTLEEPPAHVVFILATTEINKIPITIVSRCQRFDFNKISNKKIFERLKFISEKENIKINDEALEEISSLTDGGLRDAIGLLDKAVAYTDDEITTEIIHEINYSVTKKDIHKIINYVYQNNIKKYIETIDSLDDKGKDLNKLVDEIMLYLRNILIDEDNSIEMDKKVVLDYINQLNDISFKMKNTNYPKIILETFIISANKDFNPKIQKELPLENNEKNNKKDESEYIKNINNISIQSLESEIMVEKNINDNDSKYNLPEPKIETIENIEKLKKVRANNCLCNADKNLLNNLKNNWNKISEYSVNQVYGVAAGMLLDSTLTVVSNKELLVVFPYQSMAERANNIIPRIEEILKMAFDIEYKFIALDESEWNKFKSEYIKSIKNNKKYSYIEENVDYDNLFNKKDDIIVDQALEFFGNSVVQVI